MGGGAEWRRGSGYNDTREEAGHVIHPLTFWCNHTGPNYNSSLNLWRHAGLPGEPIQSNVSTFELCPACKEASFYLSHIFVSFPFLCVRWHRLPASAPGLISTFPFTAPPPPPRHSGFSWLVTLFKCRPPFKGCFLSTLATPSLSSNYAVSAQADVTAHMLYSLPSASAFPSSLSSWNRDTVVRGNVKSLLISLRQLWPSLLQHLIVLVSACFLGS